MEESVENCVENFVHTGELEEEGTTPYVLDLPFQGQERRCED
jgi:polyhydroxyalkanoate synthesis regulator phasin